MFQRMHVIHDTYDSEASAHPIPPQATNASATLEQVVAEACKDSDDASMTDANRELLHFFGHLAQEVDSR